MAGDIAAEIIAAEGKRCDAMLASDGAALAALLDDRLRFHHATGAVDDKRAYLAKVAEGRIAYAAIAWSEQQVIALGADAALLTGRMDNAVNVDGAQKQLSNRVITVWSRNGDWRLVAFQSTPLKA